MTSNEILKADVLDILFENRNKQYGAYALRKYYNNRLAVALGISMAAVFLGALLIQRASGGGAILEDAKPDAPVVKLIDFIEEPKQPVAPPPPPKPQVRPIASQTYVNNIEIVAEVDPQDVVPDMAVLQDRQIGSVTQDGDAPTQSRTIEPQPAPAVEGKGHSEEPAKEFVAVERQPEFPGGVQAWTAFLGRYLRMPEELGAGEKRTVQVRFSVGADGSIAHFEVVKSGGAAFDQEVVRVLKKMPKWKPALQNGQPIAVTFTQPVTFQALEE